jgi:holo-[acyl-carrier protein] synthase
LILVYHVAGVFMIIGTGVDIVEISRVRSLIDRYGRRFLERWFDASEIDYCNLKARPEEHFAARLAAKEAAFKALRITGNVPLCWKDIVVNSNADGVPELTLRGSTRDTVERLRITCLHLSLSHCGTFAIAMVTAEGSGMTG